MGWIVNMKIRLKVNLFEEYSARFMAVSCKMG